MKAPQVWMRQRRILMPTAEIRGTHLNTAREFAEMQERIAAGRWQEGDRLPPEILQLAQEARAAYRAQAGAASAAGGAAP